MLDPAISIIGLYAISSFLYYPIEIMRPRWLTGWKLLIPLTPAILVTIPLLFGIKFQVLWYVFFISQLTYYELEQRIIAPVETQDLPDEPEQIEYVADDNQTSFKWEHRSTDKHGQRETSQIDGTNYYYTEEPLNACTPHDYRIEGVIGSNTLSSVTILKKAVGDGTIFYSFDVTKGTYPGKVRLSWHVNLQGSKEAKTYYIVRTWFQ